MNIKSILVLAMIATLVALISKGQAEHWDFEDGGYHVIDNHDYENWSYYLDHTIANNPGTHLDLVDGGAVNTIYLFNTSSLTMTGGSVSNLLRGHQNSSIAISGGTIYELYALDNTTVAMTGGMVLDDLAAGFNSTITVSGGSFGRIRAYYDGAIYLVGTGFEVNGQSLSYGDKLSDFGTFYPSIPDGLGSFLNVYSGTITGRLEDGSYLNQTFIVDAEGAADIFVIPEPVTLILLGLGAGILRRKC
jgi:hypothetical protein